MVKCGQVGGGLRKTGCTMATMVVDGIVMGKEVRWVGVVGMGEHHHVLLRGKRFEQAACIVVDGSKSWCLGFGLALSACRAGPGETKGWPRERRLAFPRSLINPRGGQELARRTDQLKVPMYLCLVACLVLCSRSIYFQHIVLVTPVYCMCSSLKEIIHFTIHLLPQVAGAMEDEDKSQALLGEGLLHSVSVVQ